MASLEIQNLCLRCLQGLPFLTLIVLSILDIGLSPIFLSLDPHFTFSGLFYWLIYRPDLISPLLLMLLGLLKSSLIGEPLGFSSIVLLIAYGLGIKQRDYLSGKSFFIIGSHFILVIFFVQTFEWGFAMFLTRGFIDFQPLVFQLFFTILLYPFLTLCYFKIHNWVPGKN